MPGMFQQKLRDAACTKTMRSISLKMALRSYCFTFLEQGGGVCGRSLKQPRKNAHQSKLEPILSTHTGIFLGVDNTQLFILKEEHQCFVLKQFSWLCRGGG